MFSFHNGMKLLPNLMVSEFFGLANPNPIATIRLANEIHELTRSRFLIKDLVLFPGSDSAYSFSPSSTVELPPIFTKNGFLSPVDTILPFPRVREGCIEGISNARIGGGGRLVKYARFCRIAAL